MDSWSSWLPFHQFHGHGDGTASESSYSPGLHVEQDVAISSQVQQQLKQIYMLMDAEEHGHAALAPSSPATTFGSFSRSPDEDSSPMLTGASTTTTTSCHHAAEVSSLQIPLSPITYGDHHGLCYTNLDTIQNLDDRMTQEAHQEQAQRKNSHGCSGAFRPYVRHLSPRKKPKTGAYGQKAIKAAISAMARLHMARLAQWQSYQMEMAASPSVGSSCNQLQRVLLERKRREKLNDSFKALRTVLPPGPKKDKASILIRARDYVNELKSRVSELEEKNRMLKESHLYSNSGSGQDDCCSSENIEVDISRSDVEEFHLKIVVGSGCNAMDAVVAILQCLNEIGDVQLATMETGCSSDPPRKKFQIATIKLQVKSSRCDDDFLKESVMKTIRGLMQSKIETT